MPDSETQSGLPPGWVWTTLGNIGDIHSGGTPSTADDRNFNGDIPWITPADLSGYQEKFISRGRRNISQRGLSSSSATLIPSGSVLFSSRAPIGYVAITVNELTTNQGFKSIKPQDGVNSEYVYYYLKSIKDLAESQASGTTFLELSKSRFSQLPFPLPPLVEQQRIVAKIEELFTQLDAAAAPLQRARANLKRYRQSVLQAAVEGRLVAQDPSGEPAEEMLRRMGKTPLAREDCYLLPESWCWTNIGDIAYINGRDPALRNLPDDFPVSFIPMSAVDGEQGIIARPEVRPLKDVRKGFTPFSDGDVIFAKITPCMENGKAAIAQGLQNGRGFGSTEFHVLRPTEIVSAKWLYHFIRQASFRRDAKAHFAGTAGQLRVPASFLFEYPIPLPTLTEQQRIVIEIERQFSVIQDLEHILSVSLQRTIRLRQAILKWAFEGKLVVQNPQDEQADKLLAPIRGTLILEKEQVQENPPDLKSTRQLELFDEF